MSMTNRRSDFVYYQMAGQLPAGVTNAEWLNITPYLQEEGQFLFRVVTSSTGAGPLQWAFIDRRTGTLFVWRNTYGLFIAAEAEPPGQAPVFYASAATQIPDSDARRRPVRHAAPRRRLPAVHRQHPGRRRRAATRELAARQRAVHRTLLRPKPSVGRREPAPLRRPDAQPPSLERRQSTTKSTRGAGSATFRCCLSPRAALLVPPAGRLRHSPRPPRRRSCMPAIPPPRATPVRPPAASRQRPPAVSPPATSASHHRQLKLLPPLPPANRQPPAPRPTR